MVATPIGNLEDITLRAIRILKEVDLIAAEDTRHTLKLLNHLKIKKPLISYYKETEKIKAEILVEKLLKGENIALVSDAGTPAISDPGNEITLSAINNNIEVIPVPGACALISALIASGINTKEFLFIGFLPAYKKEKKEKLEAIKNIKQTVILYESPHKLISTLGIIKETLGDREIVLARELTKIHEQYLRGNVSDILERHTEPKGEYVIIIEGAEHSSDEEMLQLLSDLTLEEHYDFYRKKGYEKKEIIKKIAKDRRRNKNEIYKYFIK